jgi:hypothetical protein
MNMKQLSERMDYSVTALLDIHQRDQAEATLIRTAANLLDKLNDRDLTITLLRSQLDECEHEISQLKAKLDGKNI